MLNTSKSREILVSLRYWGGMSPGGNQVRLLSAQLLVLPVCGLMACAAQLANVNKGEGADNDGSLEQKKQLDNGFTHYTIARRDSSSLNLYGANLSSTKGSERPILVVVSGSGCGSLFKPGSNGKLRSGLPGLFRQAASGKYAIASIEKRGVALGDRVRGTGDKCTAEYHRYAGLVSRVEDHIVAIDALSKIHKPIIVVGHSEGTDVAAAIAVKNPQVARLGFLAGGGPTQIYDFLIMARNRMRDKAPRDRERAISGLLSQLRDVFTDPSSHKKMLFGHPYSRWFSYFSRAPIDSLLKLSIPIFVAHGTEDVSVPIESADFIAAEFMRRGKSNLTYRRYPGLDHSFLACKPGQPWCHRVAANRFSDVASDFLAWIDNKPLSPPGPQSISSGEAASKLCAGPTSVPLEVSGSRHYVNVTLDGPSGRKTFRFHVDTGGNTAGLMIYKSAANKIGITDAKQLPKAIKIGHRKVDLPAGAYWSILDDEKKGDHRKSFYYQARKSYSVGQLGAGFLSRFVVCIDPAAGRMGFQDARKIEVARDANTIPLIFQPGGKNKALYPFVFARFPKGGYAMLLDTGATTSMLEETPMSFQARSASLRPVVGAAGDSDMIAGQFAEKLLGPASITITFPTRALPSVGLRTAPSLSVAKPLFVSRPNGTFQRMFGSVKYIGGPNGAIANDILNRFRMLIDYGSGSLWLTPKRWKTPTSARMARVGVSLRFGSDGCPRVTQITSTNNRKTRRAIKVGDLILKIDDNEACGAWHHEISGWLSGPDGAVKRLEVRRRGSIRRLSVTTSQLLPTPAVAKED